MLRPTATVQLIWQDESGSTAVTQLNASSSLDVTDIDANATAMASILASLTNAVLVGQRIKYTFEEDERVSASGSTPITRNAAFFFQTSEDTPIAPIFVKAIKDAALETTGPRAGVAIDMANSDVIAFISAVIENGITNVFSDDISSIIDAYLQSRV